MNRPVLRAAAARPLPGRGHCRGAPAAAGKACGVQRRGRACSARGRRPAPTAGSTRSADALPPRPAGRDGPTRCPDRTASGSATRTGRDSAAQFSEQWRRGAGRRRPGVDGVFVLICNRPAPRPRHRLAGGPRAGRSPPTTASGSRKLPRRAACRSATPRSWRRWRPVPRDRDGLLDAGPGPAPPAASATPIAGRRPWPSRLARRCRSAAAACVVWCGAGRRGRRRR